MMSYSREHKPIRNHKEYPRYSCNESENMSRMRRDNMLDGTINDLKAKLSSAKEDIAYYVDKNNRLQREKDHVSSESEKKTDILQRIIKTLEIELSTTKDDLKNQFRINADLKRKIDHASDEIGKKKDRLNQTIKKLETELQATKMELKDLIFSNSLAVTETALLKNKIQTLTVENIESNKQKDCDINDLKQLLETVNAENEDLKRQIKTGCNEINSCKMKWQNAAKQFGELDRIHKIKDNLMKTMQSFFTCDQIRTSENSQEAVSQTLDHRSASDFESVFACKKCNKKYKQKGSLYRHIKDRHTLDLQKELLFTSAPKRIKRLNTIL